MKNLIFPILIVLGFIISCNKETLHDPIVYKNEKNLSTEKGNGKGHAHQASIATPFHYYSIRDTIVTVLGVQRLGFIGQLQVPFPPSVYHWSMQHNWSMTDSNTAIPAQHAEFIFGYPGGLYTNGVLNFDPNYFFVYDANSFAGQGVSTHYFVGESISGNPVNSNDVFDPNNTWFTTGSAFWQGSWNADGSITRMIYRPNFVAPR